MLKTCNFETILQDVLIDNAFENTFGQWISTDRHEFIVLCNFSENYSFILQDETLHHLYHEWAKYSIHNLIFCPVTINE
jgi:hypothetical protein